MFEEMINRALQKRRLKATQDVVSCFAELLESQRKVDELQFRTEVLAMRRQTIEYLFPEPASRPFPAHGLASHTPVTRQATLTADDHFESPGGAFYSPLFSQTPLYQAHSHFLLSASAMSATEVDEDEWNLTIDEGPSSDGDRIWYWVVSLPADDEVELSIAFTGLPEKEQKLASLIQFSLAGRELSVVSLSHLLERERKGMRFTKEFLTLEARREVISQQYPACFRLVIPKESKNGVGELPAAVSEKVRTISTERPPMVFRLQLPEGLDLQAFAHAELHVNAFPVWNARRLPKNTKETMFPLVKEGESQQVLLAVEKVYRINAFSSDREDCAFKVLRRAAMGAYLDQLDLQVEMVQDTLSHLATLCIKDDMTFLDNDLKDLQDLVIRVRENIDRHRKGQSWYLKVEPQEEQGVLFAFFYTCQLGALPDHAGTRLTRMTTVKESATELRQVDEVQLISDIMSAKPPLSTEEKALQLRDQFFSPYKLPAI